MQATRLERQATPLRSRVDRLTERLHALRTLSARLRASEYFRIGASPRFRAIQRQRTRAASRVGFLIIAGAATFDGVVVFDPHFRESVFLLFLNGGVAVLAVTGWIALPRLLRRRPEPAALAKAAVAV